LTITTYPRLIQNLLDWNSISNSLAIELKRFETIKWIARNAG